MQVKKTIFMLSLCFALSFLANVDVIAAKSDNNVGTKSNIKDSMFELTDEEAYGGIGALNYVTGMFYPAKSELFVNLANTNIPTNGRTHYVRKETAQSLAKMIAAFKEEHPNVPVYVSSSTRNFYDQKYIWEGKWNGTRKVDGKNLSKAISEPLARGRYILKFSSMPGTSRHHWGTDIDFNTLTDAYYTTGKGAVLYKWLKANASEFGFYQPYTAGRKVGYDEEKWHWSYMPLAKKFLADWNKLYPKINATSAKNKFAGADACWHLAGEYVNGISDDCK